ncbi:MAG: Ig-like domain-containing protein [Lachnospiraceae bacterium]|nr:Ig-like domain-containing protein [Lachnospiraceae bacterium]
MVNITRKTIPANVHVDQTTLGTKDLVITAMPVKKSVMLTPVVTATAFDRTVSFRSSDPHIATVSANGVVSAKAPGTATIIMRTSDGGYEARCSVTVE